jgi:hypothetical protein
MHPRRMAGNRMTASSSCCKAVAMRRSRGAGSMPSAGTAPEGGMMTSALTIDEEIAAFDPPDASWAALKAASLRLLESSWLWLAINVDWSETEIWGVHPHPDLDIIRRRADGLGLAAGLTLGLGCSIHDIDENRAVVTRRKTGARLIHRRRLTGPSVVWWKATEQTLSRRAA